MTETRITHSEDETAALARELALGLAPGSFVLLFGDLGAGKTVFVRGLAEGLGIPPAGVSSPTFALVQEYRGGRLPLLHVDLYRLTDAREIDELGIDELGAGGVVAIEWAEKLPRTPPEAIRVSITDAGESVRQITVTRVMQDTEC